MPDVVFALLERHHAGGKDAYAPVAGRTDQLKYDTRAEVAQQGKCVHVCVCVCMYVSVCMCL